MSIQAILNQGMQLAVRGSRALQPALEDDENENDYEVEGDDSEEEEFVPSPFQVALVIIVIITFLIIVTILFELIKDYAIEESSKYMR